MPEARACIGDDTLAGLLDRRAGAADLDEHLDVCADCRALVAAAARTYLEPPPDRASAPTSDPRGVRAAAVLPPGTRMGRYELESVLGQGAMGIVYAAYDPELDRRVALKLLRPRDVPSRAGHARADALRMRREARALARLAHPHVVAVHDAGDFEGGVFLALELVEGVTLAEWLRLEARSEEAVLDVLLQAGRGLAAAHAVRLVHRDFKPDNVLIGRDGRVRVTDFGLARAHEEEPHAGGSPAPRSGGLPAPSDRVTQTGALVGTPAYMSPEQRRGERPDARSDQYSFCVAAWEALSGERPFAPPGIEERRRRPAGAPRAGLRAPIARVLRRGLSTQRDGRFADMPALLHALAQAARRRSARRLFGGLAAAVSIGTAALVLVPLARRAPFATPRRGESAALARSPIPTAPPEASAPSPPASARAPAQAALRPAAPRATAPARDPFDLYY